jgi:hypothetical protein
MKVIFAVTQGRRVCLVLFSALMLVTAGQEPQRLRALPFTFIPLRTRTRKSRTGIATNVILGRFSKPDSIRAELIRITQAISTRNQIVQRSRTC